MDACDRQTDIDAAIKMNYNTHVKTGSVVRRNRRFLRPVFSNDDSVSFGFIPLATSTAELGYSVVISPTVAAATSPDRTTAEHHRLMLAPSS
ncbi:hypothetical protein DAPPUDRAFT_247121 [Daphnia pulex]|uniref:Uncharacterized protein n=1 Tax=Daphnia pulex TaxID=6669 RepID=E9GRS8_DAPPU|nr:hypothetical protein DAPPUDRAFT_247121 [Daphnia pulex]|eukprot:EFX77827.1 hypothetical protein DAPPUDRAFT_247121 [Daphnia pulex]